MSREPKKPKKEKLLLAEGATVSDNRGVVVKPGVKSVESAAPVEPEKPKKGKKAESAKEEAKKEEPKANVQKYVAEVIRRHTLPTNIADKLFKCKSKGEAKRELKAYLQGNSI